MKKVFVFLLFTCIVVFIHAQQDLNAFYFRTSGYAGFFKMSNNDPYRDGNWVDGNNYGLQFLADIYIPGSDNILVTVGTAKEDFNAVFH